MKTCNVMYKWLLLLPLIGSGLKVNSQVQINPFQYVGGSSGSAPWKYELNQNNAWDADAPIPAGFPPAQCVATAEHAASGTTLIVYGFPYYRIPGTAVMPGAVYVCVKSSSSSTFSSQTLIAGDKDGDQFGYSVAMDKTGNLIAVGAPGDDNYLYMNGSPSQGYIPGQVKSNAGAVYVLGSPYQNMAYAIRKKICAPLATNARNAGDAFGTSVDISCSPGSTGYYYFDLLAGAPGQDYDGSGSGFSSNAGAAYYSRYYLYGSSFYLNANPISFQNLSVKLDGTRRPAGAAFGASVAMSSGTLTGYCVVGSPLDGNDFVNGGKVFLYLKGSTFLQKTFSGLGTDVYLGTSVAVNSEYVAFGFPGASNNAGGVRLYNMAAKTEKTIFAPSPKNTRYGYFGRSVALSDDNRLAVTGVSGLRQWSGSYTLSQNVTPTASLYLYEVYQASYYGKPITEADFVKEMITSYTNGEEFFSAVAVSDKVTAAAFPSNTRHPRISRAGLIVYQSSNGYEPNQEDQEREEESSTQGNASFNFLNEMESQPVTISSTGSEVLVNGAGLEGRQWVIYSINGQQQSSGQLGELQGDFHRVSLNTLTPGVYVFQLAGTNVSAKILKQ